MIDEPAALNFLDLNTRYCEKTAAGRALTYAASNSQMLPHLLRSQIEAPILEESEMKLRRAFDELLDFYSVMEIAALADFIPRTIPSDFVAAHLRLLSNPSVRHYCERGYPQLLPKLFRFRLENKWTVTEVASPQMRSVFYEFLDIRDSFKRSDYAQSFLWFLEDGVIDGHDLRDTLLAAIGDPASFFDNLHVPPLEQTPLQQSLHGFRVFLSFCLSLSALLEQSKPWPLLQSAFWHYYAYWFGHLEANIRDRLQPAIQAMELWDQVRENSVIEITRSYLQQLNGAVERLVSGGFGDYLTSAAEAFATPTMAARGPAEIKNFLNSDVQIKGSLKFCGELTFEGKLDGEVQTDGLLNLGDSAVVSGNINAQSVVVRGKVNGNINAKEKIEIKARAELVGDVRATKLVIEEGVTFVGKTEINSNKPSVIPTPVRSGEGVKVSEPVKAGGR